ncbi:MAG: hypothetical protein OHK006_15330 [Thermodesulfovibrionales bacterium]
MNVTERGKIIFSIVLVCSLAGAVYANTFSSPFHFDDFHSIVENYSLHRFDLSQILKTSSRPVLDLTFALNYRFGKLDVFGYHLVNLFLHMANGVMLFFLLRYLVRTDGESSLRIPLSAALIFVAHPVQTQAVTYIVSRSSVLATTFYLLAILLFFRGYGNRENVSRAGWPWLAGAFLSACLGMATKQEAATLPLMLVIADYYFIAGGDWRAMKSRAYAHLIMCASLAVVAYVSFSPIVSSMSFDYAQGVSSPQAEPVTPFQYFLTQLHVIPYYLRLLLLPVNQNLDYDWPVVRSVDAPTALFFLLLAGLIAAGIRLFRSRRLVSFGIIWFFVTLSVTSSFFVIYDVIFEHRLYLPSAGFCLGMAVMIHAVFHQDTPASGFPGTDARCLESANAAHDA